MTRLADPRGVGMGSVLQIGSDGNLRYCTFSPMADFPISASMIVRDAEATIEQCIASVRPWVAEVCVLDTGSVDGTLEILDRLAGEPGAPIRVERAEWPDHFGVARTMALELVEHAWVLWIDADEVLMNGPLLGDAVSGAAADDATCLVVCRTAPGEPPVVCELDRIFRVDAGRFRGGGHELWWLDDPHARRWITTSWRPDPWVPWILHTRTGDYRPERYEPLLLRDLQDDYPLAALNLGRLRFLQRRLPEARGLLESFLAAGVQTDPYWGAEQEALQILAELCRRTNDEAAAGDATSRFVVELEKAATLPALPAEKRALMLELADEERDRLRGVDPDPLLTVVC